MKALWKDDRRVRYAIRAVSLFFVYVITAKIGLRFDAIAGFATLVWPPTGIAIACLLLCGLDLWPAVFLAAAVVNYTTGAPLLVAAGIGAGNALEAIVAYKLLRRDR